MTEAWTASRVSLDLDQTGQRNGEAASSGLWQRQRALES